MASWCQIGCGAHAELKRKNPHGGGRLSSYLPKSAKSWSISSWLSVSPEGAAQSCCAGAGPFGPAAGVKSARPARRESRSPWERPAAGAAGAAGAVPSAGSAGPEAPCSAVRPNNAFRSFCDKRSVIMLFSAGHKAAHPIVMPIVMIGFLRKRLNRHKNGPRKKLNSPLAEKL